jgi:branched-chain amino acid transport system permease protein
VWRNARPAAAAEARPGAGRRAAGALAALLAVLAVLPLLAPTYYLHLLTLTFCYGIMAMSLDLLVGYTGLASLGHAAYFGVAGYVVGVLATTAGWPFWPAAGMGLAAAALTAAVFGLLAIRATGPYFLIITLALGQIIWGLAYRWVSVTGGDNGLRGIARPVLTAGVGLARIQAFYYFAMAVTLGAAVLMYLVVTSPFGLSLRGIRESESRMRVLGYNVFLHKYMVFIIAGTFCGLGGILYAYYNGFVSPADVSLVASANALLMVILGGTGTLVGSLAGAALLVFLQNMLSGITQRWLTILGAVLVLAVIYAPHGVAGAARTLLGRRPAGPAPGRRSAGQSPAPGDGAGSLEPAAPVKGFGEG